MPCSFDQPDKNGYHALQLLQTTQQTHAQQGQQARERSASRMAPEPVHYLSPQAVGELMGISGDTIRRMIKLQQLKAIRMPPGNYYKILPTEVLQYVEAHHIPLSTANRRLLETLCAESHP